MLRMACMSPISFDWFLCTITEKIGVSTVVGISMDILVFLCCFQLQKQENLHKPFEWHSKLNTKHTHTPAHLHFPLIIKLLHTPLRLVFPSAIQQHIRRELVEFSIIFAVTPSNHTIMAPYNTINSNNTRCKTESDGKETLHIWGSPIPSYTDLISTWEIGNRDW